MKNVELCIELFCQLCEEAHGLMDCPTFTAFNPDKRTEVCFKNKMCFKCLRVGELDWRPTDCDEHDSDDVFQQISKFQESIQKKRGETRLSRPMMHS